jgi:hypothetical protein
MINKIIAALAIAAVFSIVRANEVKKDECTTETKTKTETETVTVEEGKKPEEKK